jgi:tRNA G18 (ribose-2'-O)-methylase SpoU
VSFAIGVDHPKREVNIGTLWRSAHAFGAAMVFTVGRRYDQRKHRGDTVQAWRHIPLLHFATWTDYRDHAPYAWVPIGIEIGRAAEPLPRFVHPRSAIYILGADDHGLTNEAAALCKALIVIPARYCLNVAVAGSIVMYDRATKAQDRRDEGVL